MADEARNAYERLSQEFGEEATDVAVRSSATAEDLPAASFAGQQESYLNVQGWEELDRAIRKCMASLFTDRAIVYRTRQGIPHRDVALSVGVQKMVRSDQSCSGVMFTLDTESGFNGVVLINAAYGLGELVVQGRVNPDEYWVHKPTLQAGFRSIVRKELGEKAQRLVYGKGARCIEERVSEEARARFVLSDDEVLGLARTGGVDRGALLEASRTPHADGHRVGQGRTGRPHLRRPGTARDGACRCRATETRALQLREKREPLVRGKSVGSRIGTGRVNIVSSTDNLDAFRDGDVLVAEMTDPDWEPVLKRAAAVVTEKGGRTCHAAIVSREHGIPCVVGTGDARRALQNGLEVTVSCAEGDEGRVYAGTVPFDREEIDPAGLPEPPVPLMLNLANPDVAFHLAQLPCAGVGLMRVEFLVANWIGVHPMALLSDEETGPAVRDEIQLLTARHENPADYFVDRLASGVAQVAAAFHPRPVIVRVLGLQDERVREPTGRRALRTERGQSDDRLPGASRYYDDRYRLGFGLECQAIRRVRETMGLDNVKVMIPFCRTLNEGRKVLAEMEQHGLVRGEHGLEVWVMCEIPSNVVLAEEFSELFDGFSIGSNDLTQLTLGVDRDSEMLSHLFDERDPGVKRMIQMVVEAAHRRGAASGSAVRPRVTTRISPPSWSRWGSTRYR